MVAAPVPANTSPPPPPMLLPLISPPENVYVAGLLLMVTTFGCTPPAATATVVFDPVSSTVTLSLPANQHPVPPVPMVLKLAALVSQVPLAAPVHSSAFG